MKYLFLLFTVLFIFNQSSAQKNLLQFSAGPNFSGTGDSFGLSFFTEYSKKLKQKLTWSASLGGTINDGTSFFLLYEYSPGRQEDGSLRYTIAGFQAASHIGYSLVGTKVHDFQARLGSIIRYQSRSTDAAAIYYPPSFGFPFPVVSLLNYYPQRTLAVGGSGQLLYNYTMKNNFCLGILAGLQFDTQGDTISQFMFTIGKRF